MEQYISMGFSVLTFFTNSRDEALFNNKIANVAGRVAAPAETLQTLARYTVNQTILHQKPRERVDDFNE